MKEIDYYPEICERFKKTLEPYLPDDATIEFSYNKTLPQMITEIENKFGVQPPNLNYIPKLKLDILFGVRQKDKKTSYILLEVKLLKTLGLSEYSQLSGYLQVAKNIKFGILFLVLKPNNRTSLYGNPLSNDFYEIIGTKNLSMERTMLVSDSGDQSKYYFKTGISHYVPNGGIDWIDTKNIGGISSFEELGLLMS